MSEAKLKNNYISVDTDSACSYGGSQLWFDKRIQKCGCSLIAAADVLLYLQSRRLEPKMSCRALGYLKAACPARTVSRTLDAPDPIFGNTAKFASDKQASVYIDIESYKKYVRRLSPAFPFIPHRGIPAVILTGFLNLYMHIRRLPYRAVFGTAAAKLKALSAISQSAQNRTHAGKDCIFEQLQNGGHNNKNKFQQLLNLKLPLLFSRCNTRQALFNAITASLLQDLPVILGIGPGVHQCLLPKAERGITFYSYDKKTDAFAPVKKVRSHFVVVTGIKDDLLTVSSWGCKYYISLTEYARYSGLDMFGLFSNIIYLTEESL